MRVLLYEFKKVFFKQKGLLLIFLFIFIKVCVLLTSNSYSIEQSDFNKNVYKNYLSKVNGKLTKDKELFIKDENNKINEMKSDKDEVVNRYLNYKISDDEYCLKINEINENLKKDEGFKVIKDQYEYIKKDSANRHFLYINGWVNLLAREDLDIVLIFLLLIIITPIFTYEYERDMVPITITTKKGKLTVPVCKLIVATIITITLTVSFLLIDYINCKVKYGLPLGGSPLQSVVFFKTSTYKVSLIQAYLYICLIKVVGFLIFTYLIIFISIIARKTVLTLFVSISSIFIPYFLYFKDSLKYKIPLPLGFIIGNGYFKGTEKSINITKGASDFIEISRYEFILQWIYMAVLTALFVTITIYKFSSLKSKKSFIKIKLFK